MKSANPLQNSGTFLVGCNYWASHAGTAMWTDWQPDIVKADLAQIAGSGLQALRVFPLWPVFQPITRMYSGGGSLAEIRSGEDLFPQDKIGAAGVSAQAMNRFKEFADLAEQNGLKLIVGLLTGWMSGRLFVPPALEGLNVLSDPIAMMWELRFVRCFVRTFKYHPAILAWDLGNECNVMASLPNHEAAYTWAATIANAIRAEDSTRPVVSGMHSLDEPDASGVWRITDQSELLDVLTTHPYPIFTPHADQEPINTLRNLLHATAQTRWYSDIGGVSGLAEETGTLGPMIASEAIAADYIRTVLFSLWAHDCHGLLWWCGYDQHHLTQAPYDWAHVERELGLFRVDRSPKPVVAEMGKFRKFIDSLPIKNLPTRKCKAVCILTQGQEQWGIAYSSFILSKQAGFDLEFQYDDQPIKNADLYLMPSVHGITSYSRHFWLALEERVQKGASLYLSHDDCLLSPFNEPFGLEVQTRQRRNLPASFSIPGLPKSPVFQVASPFRLNLKATHAAVLGAESDGNPAFTCAKLGLGEAYFLSVPIEKYLTDTSGAFTGSEAQPFWMIYQHIARNLVAHQIITKSDPSLGVTEHPLDDQSCAVVLINYSPEPISSSVLIANNWKPDQTWYGSPLQSAHSAWKFTIPANDALVFTVTKK